ncbi:MAG: hypothetical protein R3D52_00250 [Xanthobacteraceae bacterium]
MLRKRPYIRGEWCLGVVAAPIRREVQPDGRIAIGAESSRRTAARGFFRVVTLADGETIHNAFFDRNFREELG